MAPGRIGLSLFQNSSAWMLSALQRITGFDVLADISEFVGSFSGMHAGFRDRAARVESLLRAAGSTFLLVTSPNPATVDEASYFYRKLIEYRMPVGGFIVNRVHTGALDEPGAREAWLAGQHDPARLFQDLDLPAGSDLAARLAENLARVVELERLDALQLDRLGRAGAAGYLRPIVPVFDVDVHDLAGLARINRFLFPTTS
jgi:anion-transporting  ArsA/GET3 family ATPase